MIFTFLKFKLSKSRIKIYPSRLFPIFNILFLFDPITGDELIKESGNISIWNPSLNRSSELVIDTTLISLINNEFQQFGTAVTDIKYLESLMLEVDERLIQYKKDKVEEVSSETTSNVVVIKLKNAANVERKLVLTYNK